MRMALGLVGLLVVIGVIVWIMSESTLPHTQAVLDANKKAKPQVQQIAGKDTDGADARTTITLEEESSGGRMTAVTVTDVDPEGAMARYFGLQAGDSIVEIAPAGGAMMSVKEMSSADSAKDQLLTAYQNSQQITVLRGGQKLTLPAPAGEKTAPAAAPTGAGGNPLQKQLEGIKVPTH